MNTHIVSRVSLGSSGVLLAAFLLALFLGVGAAHAQSVSTSTGRSGAQQDRVSLEDQARYAQLDIRQRFGVTFQPHMAVCTVAAPGEAQCNARVIESWLDPAVRDQGRAAPDRYRGGGSNTVPPPPASAYGPAQFLGAYGLSGQASGNPLIAIVDAYDDPNIASDLNAYSSAFGIPQLPACSGSITNSSAPCFQKVNQNGSTSDLPQSSASWSLEISLDAEIAHALCQNCRILLVEASSNSYSSLMAAEDRAVAMGATVVSNSWGSPEFSGESSYDTHFEHPGVAFTFSAGDSGYGVEYPAASPYVTAVGGTSLFLGSNNTYMSELAWSGTGSGCSAYESKPAWQSDPLCSRRTVADVSADADPNTGAAVYDTVSYYGQSGWFQVGGTSLASPLIAATYALAGTSSGVQENSLPYADITASDLHDVTSGSNGSCGTYLCTAGIGYDGPTGLGTPAGLEGFLPAPPPPPPPPPAPTPSVSISATPQTVTLGRSSTLSWSSTDVSSCNASGDWSGSQSTSGTLSVTPGTTGVFTYELDCTGADGSASASTIVTVNPAPVQSFTLTASPSSLSITRGRWGNDTIAVQPAGGFSGAVTLSVNGLPSGVGASFGTDPTDSSSNLHISVSRRATPGTYTLTVNGVSDALSASTGITLTVR